MTVGCEFDYYTKISQLNISAKPPPRFTDTSIVPFLLTILQYRIPKILITNKKHIINMEINMTSYSNRVVHEASTLNWPLLYYYGTSSICVGDDYRMLNRLQILSPISRRFEIMFRRF